MNCMERYQKELETELKQFLFLCGQRDKDILISKNKKGKIGDFARLACIALVFDFRKTFLKITVNVEKYFDEFKNYLDGVNFFKLEEWMNDFIENVENPKARKLVCEVWSDTKKLLNPENFKIRNIFDLLAENFKN